MSDTDDGAETVRLSVPDMDCPSCAGKVTGSVESVDGVEGADAQVTAGRLDVTYDADRTDEGSVREAVEGAGYEVEDGGAETLSVPSMDCPSCAGKVENALDGADVAGYETQPATGRVVVEPGTASRDDVVSAIEGAGYDVEDDADAESPDSVWTSPRALKTWAGAALLVAGLVLEFVAPAANAELARTAGVTVTAADAAFLVAAAFGGQAVLRNGYYSAKNASLDIDLLMSAGILGAVAVGLYFEAATLAVLFSIAELLEQYSMDRARDSLRELMELSPDTATVVRDGEEETVPVEAVEPGETVVVRPGEKVSVDGVVREGTSAVDQSPITGESVPVGKEAGDEVFAGTVNEEGYLEVEASSEADESTI